MPKLLVYFACQYCEKVYVVSQHPQPSGRRRGSGGTSAFARLSNLSCENPRTSRRSHARHRRLRRAADRRSDQAPCVAPQHRQISCGIMRAAWNQRAAIAFSPSCLDIISTSITTVGGSTLKARSCRTIAAAWEEATVSAGQLLKSLDGRLRPGHDWKMEVCDEFRRSVFAIQISAKKPKSE